MSFIPCASNCKYQLDGACSLQQAGLRGTTSESGCIHYIPKEVTEYSKVEIKSGSNYADTKTPSEQILEK